VELCTSIPFWIHEIRRRYAGAIGNYIAQELQKDKAAGIVKKVVILTRQVEYPSSD
jgi:hypothetical protein